MENKKPIVVRMNGKRAKSNRKKDNFAAGSKTNNEQAATIEKTDAPVPTFARGYKNMKSDNKSIKGSLKPIVIAILAAIITGSILGFIMLNMFGSIQDNAGNKGVGDNNDNVAATNDSGNESKNTSTAMDNKSLTAYVIQGGVFSEKENADKWAKKFKQSGFPVIIWERDNQYYLLTGIASTKEKANQDTASMKEENMELYVKEWETGKIEAELNKGEMNWLKTYQKQWEDTLTSLNHKEAFPKKEWEKLAENPPQNSKMISKFADYMTDSLNDLDHKNKKQIQKFLLVLWQQYEKILT